MRQEILILALLVLFPAESWACKLTNDNSWSWSDEQLVERTSVIVEAKLLSEPTAKNSMAPIQYRLSVVRVLKGHPTEKEVVVSAIPKRTPGDAEYTKGCELSTNFAKGKTYLVVVGGFHPRAFRLLDTKKESKAWMSKVESLIYQHEK